MKLGIITNYDKSKESGEITDTDGHVLEFHYKDGQNMKYGEDLITPQLTGHHEQPEGYALKTPMIGDPVAYIGLDIVTSWGYARSFVELAERKYGTNFAK
jgi:hypothetical protein